MRKKGKKRYIVIIISLVCIIFFMMNVMNYEFLQEDLLFFQFFNFKNQAESISNTKKEVTKPKANTNIKSICFHVQYQNRKFKALNLTDTVDNKTLVYEKIAPGTSGRFDILLNSNQNIQNIEITVQNRCVYRSYEEYELTVINNSSNTIRLSEGINSNDICLVDQNGVEYNSVINQISKLSLEIEPGYRKTFKNYWKF